MQQGLVKRADVGVHTSELFPCISSQGAEFDAGSITMDLNGLASVVVLGPEVN